MPAAIRFFFYTCLALCIPVLLWHCEPGDAIEITQPEDTTDVTEPAQTPHISYAGWPASIYQDSAVELQITILDSATRRIPQEGVTVVISGDNPDAMTIADTGGTEMSDFTADEGGIVLFSLTALEAGDQTITITVLDSAGHTALSDARSLAVVPGKVPPVHNTVKETPAVNFINWPASAVVDSVSELSIIVLDSATLSNKLAGVAASVSLVPSEFGTISDTLGTETSDFTSSDNGLIHFQFLPLRAGHAEIRIVILDSAGAVRLSAKRQFVISETSIVETVTKQMKLEVLSPIINADGNTKSDLKVTVKDELNHPLSNIEVRFGATGGIVVEKAMTNDEGVALGWIKSERVNTIVYVTASVTSHGQNLSETQTVVFNGIQLQIVPHNPVVSVNVRDSITVTLKDAGGREITNDTVVLLASDGYFFEGGSKDSLRAVTDAFGQYTTWLSSAAAGQVEITAHALGARNSAYIKFNNNTLTMTSDVSVLPGDGSSTARITIELRDGNNTPIQNAQLKWNTTFGSFVQSPISATNSNGRGIIDMISPEGSGRSVVSVEASQDGAIIASGKVPIDISALTPHRLELTISPDNIKVGVGEATLKVQAFDAKGNILNGLLVGFKIVESAGGGDEAFEAATAYTANGFASTIFKAGSVISNYQGVKFTAVALEVAGADTTILASGDTASLTISGPPAFVSIGVNILKGINPNDGTFKLPLAAVVSDINGNLVADGTKVNFSLVPSGYYPYASDAFMWRGPTDDLGNSVSKTFRKYGDEVLNGYLDYAIIERPLTLELPWTDYNNNGSLDEGEEGMNGRPHRGEDADGDGIINTPPDMYYDINGNLRRETGTCPDTLLPEQRRAEDWKLCDFAEPFIGFRRVIVVDENDSTVERSELVFVDYTGDGTWNQEEPCIDLNGNGRCEVYGGVDSLGRAYEFNFEGGKVTGAPPLPYGKGGGVKDVIETFEGKATQEITYPQSDAVKIRVRISAESNGVKDAMHVRLPIVQD